MFSHFHLSTLYGVVFAVVHIKYAAAKIPGFVLSFLPPSARAAPSYFVANVITELKGTKAASRCDAPV
jgi:hypothetical protein